MNNYEPLPDYSAPNLVEQGPPFDPTYLNLEYFFKRILDTLSGAGGSVSDISNGTYFLPQIKIITALLTVLFITVIIYAIVRIREIRQKEAREFHFAEPALHDKERKNEQWEVVLSHVNSHSESDWRLAILEADNMLEDMVRTLGYAGESLGEKLKGVEQSDFTTIQSAWEAHKVRNQIAHDGVKFLLTQREAKRIVGLYEKVFNEFEYI